MTPTESVLAYIKGVGDQEAAKFFGVTPSFVTMWKPKVNDKGEIIGPPSKPVPMHALEKLVAAGHVMVADPSSLKPIEPIPSYEEGWDTEARGLVILMPVYRDVNPFTSEAITRVWNPAKMRMCKRHGNFLIRQRNWLATWFLASNCEWAFLIDDDVVFPCKAPQWYRQVTGMHLLPEPWAGLNTINRLVHSARSNKVTIMGGLYYSRTIPCVPQCGIGQDNQGVASAMRRGPHDKVYPTNWTASGCMLVHRKVFEDMWKAFPEIDPNPGLSYEERLKDDYKCPNFFRPVHKGKDSGEDVSFCARAADCGHPSFVDAGVYCAHFGSFPYSPLTVP